MKNLTIALIGLFLLSSCELTNVVDVDPPNNLVSENVVKDAESAEELLNGVYSAFHNQYYYMFTETTPGLLSGTMARNGFLADAEIASNSVTSENTSVASYWSAFYKAIDAANTLIDLVDPLPESEFKANRKQEIIAEARFLRAMSQFNALRYFGQFYDMDSSQGVIVRTESVDFTTRDKARSPVKEVFQQILDDLDAAIQDGPDFTHPYYASRTAAKAFKAQAMLYMGKYTDAASLADEVITGGTRSLASTYGEVFSKGFNSEEMIFMRYTDDISYAMDRKKYTYGSRYAIASDWLRNLMDTDPRATASYDTSNSAILKVNKSDFSSPTYFMRLAQVYLIKAEALTRSNAPLDECKKPLETIHSRATGSTYVSPAKTHEELLDEIFDEIIRELAFENGSDWFAAIRFGKIMNIKSEVTNKNQYILPIPLSELQANTELEAQNPGYN